MLTNDQIESLAPKMNIPLEFCGFKDMLPKKLKPNKYYCVNLEDGVGDDGEVNEGTHWVGFQCRVPNNGHKSCVYFDSYGVGPPKVVTKLIKANFGVTPWHPTKDVQSLVNEACGFYQLAWAHYVNDKRFASSSLKKDTEEFLSPFEDLKASLDYKKNEWILKHFFLSKEDPKRVPLPKELLGTIKSDEQEPGEETDGGLFSLGRYEGEK